MYCAAFYGIMNVRCGVGSYNKEGGECYGG